jgi:hypothetical protein
MRPSIRRVPARLVLVAGLLLTGAVVLPANAAEVPNPTLTHVDSWAGIRHHAFNNYPYNAGLKGYSEEEYLISGTTSAGSPYTSRIIVRRPTDAKKFNGTLIADWHNVTAGRDLDIDFMWAHDYAFRHGYAYMGVSAQAVGVAYLKSWDPVRYADLVHPNDGDFDIFNQAIKALRSPGAVNPVRGLQVRRVIAIGQSQSAAKLADYLNSDELMSTNLIDGFIVHSAGGPIRDDNGVARPTRPVMKLMADEEGISARQKDSPTFRLWEEASTAHTDGDNQAYGEANRSLDGLGVLGDACAAADITINSLHRKFILDAALHHLTAWMIKGRQPPSLPRWTLDDSGAVAKDEYGNSLGGVRLPDLEAPVATHSHGGCAAGLAGSSVPLPKAQLDTMYPTHQGYVDKFTAATDQAVNAGYLLPEDAAALVDEADARHVGADLG